MVARYYGKRARKYIYKRYRTLSSFKKSQRALRKYGIMLKRVRRY